MLFVLARNKRRNATGGQKEAAPPYLAFIVEMNEGRRIWVSIVSLTYTSLMVM